LRLFLVVLREALMIFRCSRVSDQLVDLVLVEFLRRCGLLGLGRLSKRACGYNHRERQCGKKTKGDLTVATPKKSDNEIAIKSSSKKIKPVKSGEGKKGDDVDGKGDVETDGKGKGFKFPKIGGSGKTKVDAEQDVAEVDGKGKKLKPEPQIESNVDGKGKSKPDGDVDLDFEGKGKKHKVEADAEGHIDGKAKKSKTGGNFDVDTKVKKSEIGESGDVNVDGKSKKSKHKSGGHVDIDDGKTKKSKQGVGKGLLDLEVKGTLSIDTHGKKHKLEAEIDVQGRISNSDSEDTDRKVKPPKGKIDVDVASKDLDVKGKGGLPSVINDLDEKQKTEGSNVDRINLENGSGSEKEETESQRMQKRASNANKPSSEQ